MIITDSFPVSIASQSSNQVTFTITLPTSPLFLGTLQVDGLPAGANGVIGTLSPVGDAAHPSVHNFHLGNARFQQLLQSLGNPVLPLSIQITYDNVTLKATDLRLPTMQMAANG
ncbi:MAG TPA: hypothetical protein VER11_30460 [Polyangiaceae bacterium]|nr:hypothetical protein [Polyangiaceae bacterium]